MGSLIGHRRSLWRLIVKAFFLFCTARRGGRKSSALALGLLRLGGGLGARQESADHHFSPCHHLGVWVDLSCFLLDWRGRIYLFFNGNMLLTALRDALGKFVPDQGKIVRGYIAQIEVPGFTKGQLWGEEIRVPHIYVRQQRAI